MNKEISINNRVSILVPGIGLLFGKVIALDLDSVQIKFDNDDFYKEPKWFDTRYVLKEEVK